MKSVLDFFEAAVETIFPVMTESGLMTEAKRGRTFTWRFQIFRERVESTSNESPVVRTQIVCSGMSECLALAVPYDTFFSIDADIPRLPLRARKGPVS